MKHLLILLLTALVISMLGCDAKKQTQEQVQEQDVEIEVRAIGGQAIAEHEIELHWGEELHLVIAEGAGEPRSLGSYSVRVYQTTASQSGSSGGERDNFVTGLIFARDGFLHDTLIADIDDDQLEDLVVVFANAGSGDYITAHAWRYLDDKLSSIAIVEGLDGSADVVAALREQMAAVNALVPETKTEDAPLYQLVPAE